MQFSNDFDLLPMEYGGSLEPPRAFPSRDGLRRKCLEGGDIEQYRPMLLSIFRQSPSGQLVLGAAGDILMINCAAYELLGLDEEISDEVTWQEIKGLKDLRAQDGSFLDETKDPLFLAMHRKKHVSASVHVRATDTKEERWLSVMAFPILDEQGNIEASAAMLLDITAFKEMQDILYYQATHDSLTGLSNRAFFSSSVGKAFSRSRRNRLGCAILAIDLDKFKEVNDRYGHAAGDELLVKVAKKLEQEVRDTDLVARMGGDEFCILLTDITGDENKNVGEIAGRICEKFSEPLQIMGHAMDISVSIGVVLFPKDGLDERTLLKKADAAMYRVKQSGRNNWKFWEESDSVSEL